MAESHKWYRLTVTLSNGAQFSPGVQDTLSSLFVESGSPGVELTPASIVVYFSSGTEINGAKRLAEQGLTAFSEGVPVSLRYEIAEIEQQNWESDWKKYFKPVRISPQFTVIPPWEKYAPESGEIVLVIRPEQAFGTGLHESTRLIINLIEKYFKPGFTLLDVGAGTGIAAIAAAKLNARMVIAVDIDAEAAKSARWHAAKNGVAGIISVKKTDIAKLKAGRFNVVAANIEWKLLSDFVDKLPLFLPEDGILLLSGILESELQFVRNALDRNGFAAEQIMRMGEWAGLAARKRV